MTNLSRPYSDRVARYIRGEMSAEEASQLEIELLDDDELFNEVQLQSALEQGLRTTAIETPTAEPSATPWFKRLLQGRFVATASIAVLGVALVIQTVKLERIETANLAGPVQINIPELILSNERSTDRTANRYVVHYPKHLNSVRVKIDVATASQVSLSITDDDKNEQNFTQLSPEQDGYLHIDLSTGHAKKNYTLTVANESQRTNYQVSLIPDRESIK